MALRDDAKAVLVELSPILAGFKLALIVISYFGLGSVAKWIISYWYPFTRWIWDSIAQLLSLPTFPILVKDSLTALVFFLPLGITAIWQKVNGVNDSDDSHRVMGALFGILFLIVICKDVLTSIFSSLASSFQDLSPLISSNDHDTLFAAFAISYMALGIALYALLIKARKSSPEGNSFLSHIHKFENRFREDLVKNRKKYMIINLKAIALSTIALTAGLIIVLGPKVAAPVVSAIAILSIIVISLFLATLYAPKKLYITTGAAIAFMVAAVLFELFITVKTFMENIPNT